MFDFDIFFNPPYIYLCLFDCFLHCLLVSVLVLIRSGSVVAQFQPLFKNILEDEKALNPLKKAVEDGNLGPLTVDPESLKIIKAVEGNQKHPQQE